jgi:phosphoglycerate dehydrogenase-like enzyme
MTTILYPEGLWPDDTLERGVFGPDVRVIIRKTHVIAELDAADCEAADALMVLDVRVSAQDLTRFPRLRTIVRMGVGYDVIDRAAAAARGIMVCNIPDYGTTEVADHAMALMLSLRRGIAMYYDAQRGESPGPWGATNTPLVRRLSVQRFGIVGLGRIGTAVALRAKAFGFRVTFYDPYRSVGTELSLGIERAPTLEALLETSDVLSLHTPLTPETRGMIGLEQLRLLPENAVVVNTSRGPVMDLAALEVLLREGSIAGAGLDVIPVEPPVEPVPDLLRAYRAAEPWLRGRLVVTPHAAFHSPEAYHDIRRKSAETIFAALFTDRPQNVIAPDSY